MRLYFSSFVIHISLIIRNTFLWSLKCVFPCWSSLISEGWHVVGCTGRRKLSVDSWVVEKPSQLSFTHLLAPSIRHHTIHQSRKKLVKNVVKKWWKSRYTKLVHKAQHNFMASDNFRISSSPAFAKQLKQIQNGIRVAGGRRSESVSLHPAFLWQNKWHHFEIPVLFNSLKMSILKYSKSEVWANPGDQSLRWDRRGRGVSWWIQKLLISQLHKADIG